MSKENKKLYRLTRKELTRSIVTVGEDKQRHNNQQVIKAGDIFTPTNAELNAFGDRMEVVVVAPEPSVEAAEQREPEEAPAVVITPDPPDDVRETAKAIEGLSVKRITAAVDDGRLELDHVLAAEQEAPAPRATLIRWVKKRKLEELRG